MINGVMNSSKSTIINILRGLLFIFARPCRFQDMILHLFLS